MIKEHWNTKYIIDRIMYFIYRKKNPEAPWLTKDANKFLDSYIKNSHIGLEVGSGKSTIWISKMCKKLFSMEHNRRWYSRLKNNIERKDIKNVEYIFREAPESAKDIGVLDSKLPKYVKKISEFDNCKFDFVIIDGKYRNYCARASIEKIKEGGMLVIDDVNWYLPSRSRSPDSRSIQEGPADKIWRDVWKVIKSWPRYWTSSGVKDTAFFFKPCDVV